MEQPPQGRGGVHFTGGFLDVTGAGARKSHPGCLSHIRLSQMIFQGSFHSRLFHILWIFTSTNTKLKQLVISTLQSAVTWNPPIIILCCCLLAYQAHAFSFPDLDAWHSNGLVWEDAGVMQILSPHQKEKGLVYCSWINLFIWCLGLCLVAEQVFVVTRRQCFPSSSGDYGVVSTEI